MSGWEALDAELDAWRAAGRTATFWWRDDDAVEPTPALARLLALSAAHRVPLALAVVPQPAVPSLAALLAVRADVTVLPHGLAHQNHAPAGTKSGELGAARPVAVNLADAARGWRQLEALCGARAFPVLVPPWNRIDPGLVPHLAGAGFCGLSTWGPRRAAWAAPGLLEINTHLDVIDWRHGRRFVGEGKALAELVGHLAARRDGRADAEEPSGLLTHHLVHDEEAWRFLDALLARSIAHPAARWEGITAFFPAHRPLRRAAGRG